MPVSAEQWRASVGCNNPARWHGRDKGKEKQDFEEQLMTYITFILEFHRELKSLLDYFQGNNSIHYPIATMISFSTPSHTIPKSFLDHILWLWQQSHSWPHLQEGGLGTVVLGVLDYCGNLSPPVFGGHWDQPRTKWVLRIVYCNECKVLNYEAHF